MEKKIQSLTYYSYLLIKFLKNLIYHKALYTGFGVGLFLPFCICKQFTQS